MQINKALWSLFLLTSLVSLVLVSPVSAGGGPVYINVGSTLSSWSNSEIRQIVAKVHLHPDIPCVGTKITFKYEDQKDGDNVSTGTINSNTYVIEEVGGRWLNGKSVYDCGTYAKYTSRNRELKYAIIVVSTPKGETYERKVALNFQSNEPIQGLDDNLPWDDELFPQPTNNPAPSVVTSTPKPSVSAIVNPTSPKPTISSTPNGDNTKVEELNKKVENLQNQLEESKQRQSALETRLNLIISWIKSIFPFFK